MELNKIYNMDCLIGMEHLLDNSVNVTLTDIPYGEVNRDSNGLRTLDKEAADVFEIDMNTLLNEIYRVTNGQIIIFCGKEQFSKIYSFFAKKKGTTRSIIWEKTNPSPMNGQYIYLSGVKHAVWFKPHGRKVFNAHCKNTVFTYKSGSRKIHPTQKNVDLFKELITDNTNANEVVFDPFMGSGTTAIACLDTNRQYIGFELDKTYYEKSLERIENHTTQTSLFEHI